MLVTSNFFFPQCFLKDLFGKGLTFIFLQFVHTHTKNEAIAIKKTFPKVKRFHQHAMLSNMETIPANNFKSQCNKIPTWLIHKHQFVVTFQTIALHRLYLNPFPCEPFFFMSAVRTSLFITLWKKEKLLVKSNFSLIHFFFTLSSITTQYCLLTQ